MRVAARFGAIFLVWQSISNVVANDYACNFTLDGLEFDLCPLFRGSSTTIAFVENTPPTTTAHRYAVGLGAPLKRDVTLPSELQCPEGTWICLTVLNTRPNRPSEPTRILQVVPVAGSARLDPRAKMLAKVHDNDLHEPLQVTLHGGQYNRRAQTASFQFHCDHTLDEPTAPQFAWQWNGTHTFSWRTKHACPRALPPGAPGAPDPDNDPPATPPPDPDADLEDGDRVTRPAPVSMLLVSFWVFIILFTLRICYASLSRWGRRLASRFHASRFLKTDFRPSSSNLVRWAAEENPEEYDIGDHTFSDGEETPLTPNSKGTFATSQYGSAG
ncbi:autophagy-related protein 27-domain-containing protein [Mycena vitilis]|nr:autophagy-related protein 27-domain-containing protein [Mycena vitilis]